MEPPHVNHDDAEPPVLPEDVPVVMPELPAHLLITTAPQFKAVSDTTRTRIIAIIQHQPMTAKQIADRLGIPPGTIGHHLQVLEAAGLAQVIARRQVRGTIAKYYTRTARIFLYDLPPEIISHSSVMLDFVNDARSELLDIVSQQPAPPLSGASGFPHARIAPAQAELFERRLMALLDEFVAAPADPTGEVFSLCVAFFRSPAYLQVAPASPTPPAQEE